MTKQQFNPSWWEDYSVLKSLHTPVLSFIANVWPMQKSRHIEFMISLEASVWRRSMPVCVKQDRMLTRRRTLLLMETFFLPNLSALCVIDVRCTLKNKHLFLWLCVTCSAYGQWHQTEETRLQHTWCHKHVDWSNQEALLILFAYLCIFIDSVLLIMKRNIIIIILIYYLYLLINYYYFCCYFDKNICQMFFLQVLGTY